MKKRNIAAALAFSLVLAGCGPSLETTRNEAFNDLEQMSGLSRIEHDEVAFELNVATDQSGIDRAMEKARKFEAEHIKREAAKQEKMKNREDVLKVLETLPGKSLLLLEAEERHSACNGVAFYLNPNGALEVKGDAEACTPLGGWDDIQWNIERDTEKEEFGLTFNFATYEENLNDDGTISLRWYGINSRVIPTGKYKVQ